MLRGDAAYYAGNGRRPVSTFYGHAVWNAVRSGRNWKHDFSFGHRSLSEDVQSAGRAYSAACRRDRDCHPRTPSHKEKRSSGVRSKRAYICRPAVAWQLTILHLRAFRNSHELLVQLAPFSGILSKMVRQWGLTMKTVLVLLGILCCIWLVSLATAPAFAVSTATLTGQVTDPQGRVVPEATIEATNVDTNISSIA